MGLPLFEETEHYCLCCNHDYCDASRKRLWCAHWFRITLAFYNLVELRQLLKAFDAKLYIHDYVYRLERHRDLTSCRVMLWLCIDPWGSGVTLHWMKDVVSSVLALRSDDGTYLKPLDEETEVIYVPCCINALVERLSDDHLLLANKAESPDLCYSEKFVEHLDRFYTNACVDECVLLFLNWIEQTVKSCLINR